MARNAITFDRLATLLAYGAAAFVACLSPAQSDTYWQLRAGRDIWRTATIPRVDHYSYTAFGRAWPDHEWLWQAIAYPLHALGGMPLLTAASAVAAVGALVLSRRLAPPGGRVSVVALLGAVVAVSPEWSLRPQVASLLLFALTLVLVARERYLWLPPLFLLWANLHAGVAAGGVILVAATVLALAQQVRHRIRQTRARLLRIGTATLACGLVTLINPMGVGLWAYVLGSGENPAHVGNADWQSAFRFGPVQACFWAWALVFAAVVIARHNRFRTWAQKVLVAAGISTAPLAMAGVRNIGFFVVAALPAVIVGLAPPVVDHDVVPRARALLAAAGVSAGALLALIWWIAPARLNWHPLSAQTAAAVRSCPKPLYNTYDAGGYLLWFVPDAKVFIDSRADPYPAAFVSRDRKLETSGRYKQLFSKYGIRCAVVAPNSRVASALEADRWSTRAADGQWLVLARPH